MNTNIPKPLICEFVEVNKGKHRTVRHFNPVKGKTSKGIFSNLINISNNRAYAKSNPKYWIKCREGNKWSRPVTGLFKTKYSNVFFGDLDHKTSLLIMKFDNDDSTITAYLYQNYYTRDLEGLLRRIIKL